MMPSETFGPTTFAMSPELRMMPLSKPIGVAPPVNVPPASLAPVYVTLETDSPPPVRVFARPAGVTPWARSVVAIAALADGAKPRVSRIAKDAKMTSRRMVPLPSDVQSDRS
ncbi:MAG: hypothetical protein E6G24_02935 [Actinobacteria bacterium]|nr:MAG: hypothetical protein E6G24_02935 [Actinomycetota bacterium]